MRAIALLIAVVFTGCVAQTGPSQPEWMTECNASCANGYQIRWEQLLEAPKGDALARELEQQCITDLAVAGCTWPICACTAQERR